MLIQKEFLNKLRDFGLNTYEARLWTALLSRGMSTAGELSDIANVPRSRSYDVLESLEKKGFVIMKVGKPIKYIAVPPEDVIERVKRKLNKEAEEKSSLIEELKTTKIFDELNLLHSNGIELIEPGDLTGSFRGRENIYNHIESMIKSAQKTITIMTTGPGVSRKEDRFKRALKKAKQRGVKIRFAAPLSKESKTTLKSLVEVTELKNSNYEGRFVIIDNKEILFMLMDDKNVHPSYDVGVWIKSPYFSSLFGSLFESQYSKMTSEK